MDNCSVRVSKTGMYFYLSIVREVRIVLSGRARNNDSFSYLKRDLILVLGLIKTAQINIDQSYCLKPDSDVCL